MANEVKIPDHVKLDLVDKGHRALIDAGTHFFCQACLYTMPVEYRSKNKKYCLECNEVITNYYNPEETDIPENGTAATPPAPITQTQDIDVESFVTPSPANSTTPENVTPGNGGFVTKKNGRPKADLPEEEIRDRLAGGKKPGTLAKEYGVSRMTIWRIGKGQKALVFPHQGES